MNETDKLLKDLGQFLESWRVLQAAQRRSRETLAQLQDHELTEEQTEKLNELLKEQDRLTAGETP